MSEEWKDEKAKETLENFKEAMENLDDRMPSHVADFIAFVEKLKTDKEALENFRREILKNYGE